MRFLSNTNSHFFPHILADHNIQHKLEQQQSFHLLDDPPSEEECSIYFLPQSYEESNLLCVLILAAWCLLFVYAAWKWIRPFFKGYRVCLGENFYYIVLIFPLIILRIITFSVRVAHLEYSPEGLRIGLQLINPGFVPLFILYSMIVLEWIFFACRTFLIQRGKENIPEFKRTGKIIRITLETIAFLGFGSVMLFGMIYRFEETGEVALNIWSAILLGACTVCVFLTAIAYVLVMVNLVRLNDKKDRSEAIGRFTHHLLWISVAMVFKNVYYALITFTEISHNVYSGYLFLFVPELITAYHAIQWVDMFHRHTRHRFSHNARVIKDWDFGLSKVFFWLSGNQDTLSFRRWTRWKKRWADRLEHVTLRFRGHHSPDADQNSVHNGNNTIDNNDNDHPHHDNKNKKYRLPSFS